MGKFLTIDDIEASDKRVIVRADLNVPIQGGKISDMTRIRRASQTVIELLDRGAKVIVMSHFGRPKGKFDPSLSLAPIADGLSITTGRDVKFAVDCIGAEAENAVEKLQEGELLLLENLRFYEGETANDPEFAAKLANLGDVYVNDAFSCSHREHASVAGITKILPHAAGRLMQEELENLENILGNPEKPLAAIIGGSKISTKLSLLDNLLDKVDLMVIGGGMANTFLKAQGHNIGKSIYEDDLLDTARAILARAQEKNCEILLPVDGVVTQEFKAYAESSIVGVVNIGDGMMLDIGPKTVSLAQEKLGNMKTIVWNGPLGAFEMPPFESGTVSLARAVAGLTSAGQVKSIAGGGDTVSAFSKAGLTKSFTYLSTAGGAFLEWLEGKELPGVACLRK
ncbi:MAG: phosphoglycerate kinase [Alphaproteobacteria bacterium CG11_big_fil_rev_8_21_14_0_20_44_7]|nr:MAG: phosphoglycerate kinase [Alphaproteobacteria bacterium CG11_big_fil_rev_8_21_14_0_20_44_7]